MFFGIEQPKRIKGEIEKVQLSVILERISADGCRPDEETAGEADL
jgi:hypothetical protein